MKTDNYLTLCLEEAAKSPLRYRHGCIVVRGGKVIGRGYNDYRPGFDGGVLRHGRIASPALDGPSIVEWKEKLKQNQKKQQSDVPSDDRFAPYSTKPFTPFEGMGGSHTANMALSMHSEMMAIHSALTASATMSSVAFSREKPCFKLSSCDKRKARLRREALLSYVTTVCEAATGTGKLWVQECSFEASTSQPGSAAPEIQQGFPARPKQYRGKAAAGAGAISAAARPRKSGVSRGSEWGETTTASEREKESPTVSVRPVQPV